MTSQGGPPESDSEARDFRSPLDAEAPFTSALGEYQRTEAERQQLAAIIEGARDAIWSWTPDGIITRWNAEAERLFGYASEEMIGKSLLTLVPPDREEVARDVIARLRRGSWYGQYETVRLHKSGSLVAVELTVSPLRDPSGNIIGAATVCRDITERKHFQESLARRVKELAALYQLTDRLQHADSIGASCDAALDAIFDALDCPRASILLFDEASVMRFVAWRGLSEGYRRAVDGHSPWTADTSNPEPIFVSDIGAAAEPEALKQTIRTEGIAALAFIPLLANGRLIGKFMTYYPAARDFEPRERDLAVTIARQLAFAIERRRAAETKQMLLRELQHRCNNLLGIVQGIASRSLTGSSLADAGAVFLGRLHALGRIHQQLTASNWSGLDLADIVRLELAPFAERVRFEGPRLLLSAQQAQNFSLALHELATNAGKHGALSVPEGEVRIAWTVSSDDTGAVLRFEWTERNGPPVRQPTRRGFGTTLLSSTFKEAAFSFQPEGLHCAVAVRLKSALGAPGHKRDDQLRG